MKIESIRETLGEALLKAEKISGKNVTLPVLSGLYLSAHKNTLSIKATNLDLGISINLPVKVLEPGNIVVPAHTLSTLISSLIQERSVMFNTKEQILEVRTLKTKTNIKTLPSEDFPLIPEVGDEGEFSLPARDLIFGIKSVIYASAVRSVKPELSSISITADGDHLTFAATDSFRLAEKKIRIKKPLYFKQILIPQKNAIELIRIFEQNDEEIKITIEEHQAAFRSSNIYLTSRVIDGIFPDYKQIIPKKITSSATVLKQDLIASLKTSIIFLDTFNQLTLKLMPKAKHFEIESKNSTAGENINSIEAALTGEDLSININHRFLSDCFQSVTTDGLSLEFSGQAKPVVVKGVGDTSFLYLVMPMNRS